MDRGFITGWWKRFAIRVQRGRPTSQACPHRSRGLVDGRFSPDVIEHALAHRDQNAIRAIYNRTSYWNARVDMMQAWSDMLDALRSGALVTALAA